MTLAGDNVRQRIYKQPIIRRFKSPSPKSVLPVLMPQPIMAAIPELPLPPQPHKIPAKGEARRRYATSTPASRCLAVPAQNRLRLSKPPSRVYECPMDRRVECDGLRPLPSLLIEAGSASPPPLINPFVDNHNAKPSNGIDGLVCSVQTSPSRSSDPPRESSSGRRPSKPNDKMALRNLLS